MNLQNRLTFGETGHYNLRFIEGTNALLLAWKYIEGLSASDFRIGIADFARQCVARKPRRAVIDATELDQNSAAVSWLRGQEPQAEEDYNTWWLREIVPLYNEAGIASLTVGTGDPNAPGELAGLPPGVNFRIAYLPDLKTALNWRPA